MAGAAQIIGGSVAQGGDVTQALKDYLATFKGRQKHFRGGLSSTGPYMAAGLYNSPAYQYLQDFQNRPTGIEGAFGKVAGQIGEQGRQFQENRMGQLSLQGLGRSSAQQAVAQQAALGSATAQANVFADLQARQQEMRVAFAQQAFDVDQAIAQLVLSSIPGYQPQQSQQGGLGTALGAAGGTALGALFGGPIGAMAGGSLGGSLGGLFG